MFQISGGHFFVYSGTIITSSSCHKMLWYSIHVINLFFYKVWVDRNIRQFINWHPSKDNIAVILMGHKLPCIRNIRTISQFDQVVKRNVMCLGSIPFPEAFLCPEQLANLDVSPGFFLVFPDKAIRRGFTDLDMTTRQRIFAAIPITLNQ